MSLIEGDIHFSAAVAQLLALSSKVSMHNIQALEQKQLIHYIKLMAAINANKT